MANNLTGMVIKTVDDSCCPLCDSSNIEFVDTEYDFGAIYYTHKCRSCGSSFTFSYWVANAIINNDKHNED